MWTQLREDLWLCDYKVPGLPARSWALRLGDGRFCVGSPGVGLAAGFGLGDVAALVAPNNFHHMGLSEWRECFPDAVVAASEGARPRLGKQGHDGLVDLDVVVLPDHARFVTLPGTRSGEVWLVHRSQGVVWVVCDAFFNLPLPRRRSWQWFMWANRSGPGLAISLLQKWGGLRDRRAFTTFATDLLASEAPDVLVPMHGAVDDGPDLPERLRALIGRRL